MLLEVLGAVGVTNILVRGSVFAWLRRAPGLKSMLGCAMCTGWWVGVGLGLLEGPPIFGHWRGAQVLEVLELGGGVSALATLLDFVLAYLDSNTETTKS